ncbi:MAG: M56 family metallopeptidase [Flavobacteriaceae bacterium]|nr:M56 family metallopeptidase [Flavobacteriaceae bacterium]
MIHYIIQVIVCQLLFLVVYDLFLKRETFFGLNRAYLILTPLFSFLIPLMEVSLITQSIPQAYQLQLPEIIVGGSEIVASSFYADWMKYLLIFWALGALSSLCFFGYKWFRYLRLKNSGTVVKQTDFTLVELPGTSIAFSFFKHVFLGEDLTQKQRKSILKHELVHVRDKHTWDLLWFELLRILFWFNPLIYVYQKRITVLQEYIADEKAIGDSGKKEYYESLLSTIFQTESISFINTFFNHSIIKNRIVMLQKSKSKNSAKWKYLWVLPVLGIMFTYTACSEGNAQESEPETVVEGHLVGENPSEKDKEYAFKEIEQVPVYPGCEGLQDQEAQKCFTQKITEFVMANFNVKSADKLGLEGRQRISSIFKIDKEGNVTDVKVRAPHPELEEIVQEVITKLPQMQPGKVDGRPVTVRYALPIIFAVE